MPTRSPFDYDVSVSAEKARRARGRRRMTGAVEGASKTCDWPGCEAHAPYRAPVAPDRLDEYQWFCLEHVRTYNANWNFFADVEADALEEMLRRANAWERPTWRMGSGPKGAQGMHAHGEGRAWERFGFSDPFEVLGESASINPAEPANDRAAPRPRRRLTRLEAQALETLGLSDAVENRAEIRARYRDLVKDLHPDMNGGEARDPERLREVLRAWDILKASRSFAD